jgi:hypothetical protein
VHKNHSAKNLITLTRLQHLRQVGAKNYRSVISTDYGLTWSAPREMNDTSGRGMGVCRPRLLMLGDGKGPLLLSGGRLYTEKTRDVLLWVRDSPHLTSAISVCCVVGEVKLEVRDECCV